VRPDQAGVGRDVELLDSGLVYFDTSAWNHLADRSDGEAVIAKLQRRGDVVFGSVYSAGEILKTPDPVRRQRLCAVMECLLGDRALLERPVTLAKAAAEAVLRGETTVLLRSSGPGRTIWSFVRQADDAACDGIAPWLANEEANLERFRVQVEPAMPSSTRFHSPEVLNSDDFLKLLLSFPAAAELGLSLCQVRQVRRRSDIWQAVARTLASIVAQVLTRSPKRKNGHHRPGAVDLWQAVYLGVAEVFVTSDERQLAAVQEVSASMRRPRRVVSTAMFLADVERRS